jgi:predicted transcriptional regulator
MGTMPIHWKVQDILAAHSITGYQFWKASGLPKRSAYRIVNGDARNVNADTLDATVRALRSLTGKPLTVCDLLEYREEN